MISKKLTQKQFQKHMVQHGTPSSFGGADEELEVLHHKLKAEMAHTVPCPLTEQGRRINNFCIGSDPEFVFIHPAQSKKIRANDVGLRPGLAAGCDQNLRLAELRGYPTTSAVEHVAGLMASLRWMYRTYPRTLEMSWRAGAHYDGDGIGGHVHFGRKRPNRDQEVLALDGMANIFRRGSFFSNTEWERRIQGDALNQRYGDFGDIRPQLHGYEYRTLPSWLCSPMKAFTILTASKLAVIDPEMTIPWRDRTDIGSVHDALEVLGHFARYHAGRDDDAWILKHLMTQDVFLRQAETWWKPCPDFKANWGLNIAEMSIPSKQPTLIIPAVIAPHASEVKEMTTHLSDFTPLGYRELAPTFKNTLPNKRYYWMYKGNYPGMQYGGAGDLLHNLVGYEDVPIQLRLGNGFFLSTDLFQELPLEGKRMFKELFPGALVTFEQTRSFQIDRHCMGVDKISSLRKFLLHCNYFPLWTIDTIKESSYSDFTSQKKLHASKPPSPLERKL